MLHIETFTFNPFQENTFVLFDHTNNAVIIDPGCYGAKEENMLIEFIESNKLKVTKILNTHCHVDHVLGNYALSKHFNVSAYFHEADLPTLKSIPTYASMYGFNNYTEVEDYAFINEGDEIEIGNSKLQVLFTPGHAPGHVVFYNHETKNLINGDVLFNGSIGRTDLPGGNFEQLIESIHEKLFPLHDDVIVHCGHGPSTTIKQEKSTNPFCKIL